MARHAMNPVDAAWYHMDGPANPAMVTGVLLTSAPLDFSKVRALYMERLLGFARFRQRVVEDGIPIPVPHWEDVDDFDIERHMHHVALPAPYDEQALRSLLSDVASTPLDPALPLWQVLVVDDVAGGSALIMRCHHCMADGTAMMAVIGRLFDAARAPTQRRGTRKEGAARGVRARRSNWLASAFDGVVEATRTAVDRLAHPAPLVEQAARVLDGAGMLAGELLKPDDPPSPFKARFQARQQVAWSEPVSIAAVKAIGARHGAKVNDVLVAAMTGALRAYLRQRGVDVDHTRLRAMVPVDLRPPERIGELGNEFGLVVLELAVSSRRRLQRLAQTQARMTALKRSSEPWAMLMLMNLFGRGPKMLQDVANDLFGSKTSVVLTNVAGPREQLRITGVLIDRIMFWVPHPGRQLGVGISILSYRGLAWLGVMSDAHLVPDPESITRQFGREFEAMRRSAARRPGPNARAPRHGR